MPHGDFMKVLFVTSEHPADLFGGLGTFTREFVRELRKFAQVKCVYFHLRDGDMPLPDETIDIAVYPHHVFEAFSQDARILEVAASFRAQLDPLIKEFKPDVIHCNDRQTYLPFRFDNNVLYSSHLIYTDLIASSQLNDIYFQEVKVERCALEHSAIVAAYSDFAAKSALKLAGGMCVPVVLPLGLRTQNFMKAGIEKCCKNGFMKGGKLRVTYFGRFDNVQKGLNDFIYAVNALGKDFKEQNNIIYSLYGRGTLDPYVDATLFDNIKFLKGQELYKAYSDADIVVMPSRYEPFGFTGLEAMAAGCLVLLPSGLGMDMYAIPDWNCLEIPNDGEGISKVLKNAVENFQSFGIIRENALRTAKNWTWERCVQAHLYIYNQIAKGRVSHLSNAYRIEEREILDKYNRTNDVEKIYCAETERQSAFMAVKSVKQIYGNDCKILVLSGVYAPDTDDVFENVQVYSVLNEGNAGITVRPECLPFDDEDFDVVICCGAWETVLDPCGSLMEMLRVAKKNVIVLYYNGQPHEWQTYQMENDEDWKMMNCSKWECVHHLKDDVDVIGADDSNNQKILAGLINMEKIVPYGAVIYNRYYHKKEVRNESIA